MGRDTVNIFGQLISQVTDFKNCKQSRMKQKNPVLLLTCPAQREFKIFKYVRTVETGDEATWDIALTELVHLLYTIT